MMQISHTGLIQKYSRPIVDYAMGMQMTVLWTMIWVIMKAQNFYVSSSRPATLFIPENYYSKVLMPTVPSSPMFYSVSILAFLLLVVRLSSLDRIITRVLLLFFLLWINLYQWSFGFESVVGHLILYIHFFSIFIPIHKERLVNDPKKLKIIHSTINWYYLGLLIPYTISGIWKWIGLGYKLFIKKGYIHWLHPDAALVTMVTGYRSTDLPFNHLVPLFKYPLLWQIGFVIVLLLQTICIIAAFVPPLRFLIGMALVGFHLINSFVFDIEFVFTPIAIFILFFPYHLFFYHEKVSFKSVLFHENGTWMYTKEYENGDKDRYTGFEAKRENCYDKHPILGALFYLPGLSRIYGLVIKKNKKKNQ